VTGASRGIGRTIVEHLAASGHQVAITARSVGDLQSLADSLDVPTLVLPADVTDPGAPDRLVADVVAAWGGIDVAVLNAGEAISAPIHRTDDELWQQMLEVNLTAPFRFIRAAVPPMKQAGFGRIIVIASIASKVGAPYITAYSAAKHGVLGAVRSAAIELATTGVTVNAVCPGYVDTPLTDRALESIVAKTGLDMAAARATLENSHPIKRLITTDEVASVVDMLVADTGGITGQGIVIDGGSVQS
jgi:NAD(P)-dependent dehydrogenase (short-subunit alcohol dehydrogenase family)